MASLWQELNDERNTDDDTCPIRNELRQLFNHEGLAAHPLCSAARVDHETTIIGIAEARKVFQELPREGCYRRFVSFRISPLCHVVLTRVNISSTPR